MTYSDRHIYSVKARAKSVRVNPEIRPTQTHRLAVVKQELIRRSFGTASVATLFELKSRAALTPVCRNQYLR